MGRQWAPTIDYFSGHYLQPAGAMVEWWLLTIDRFFHHCQQLSAGGTGR